MYTHIYIYISIYLYLYIFIYIHICKGFTAGEKAAREAAT